jgi:hypothetical protein
MHRSHLFLCKSESQHLTYSSFTASGRMCLIWAKCWWRNRLQEHIQDTTLHQFCFAAALWNRSKELTKRNCMRWSSEFQTPATFVCWLPQCCKRIRKWSVGDVGKANSPLPPTHHRMPAREQACTSHSLMSFQEFMQTKLDWRQVCGFPQDPFILEKVRGF